MRTFEMTLEQIQARIHADATDSAIDPRCVPILRHHGRAVERAVVLFHGFTNCPRQFAELADLAFARGANVYVPRLPHHGCADKLSGELSKLTTDELAACAEAAATDASALGARVDVLGLSVGGTMAMWLAQTQPINRAIAVAPFVSIDHLPGALEPLVAGALLLVPNIEMWWNPALREAEPPPHGYPRFPTHALANSLRLGERTRDLARTSAPRAAFPLLVTNDKDPAIDNGAARDVLALWREHTARAEEYVFTTLDGRHDIIEPTTYRDARTLVYPQLLELLAL